jgi:septum site-determining protein MinD
MGEIIAVVSGKGGVGKTMFTSNLGAVLALQGYKVVLIDMDMGLRNLDLFMGLENRVVYDLADVLGGICRIKQALIRDRRFPELYIIASPQNRYKVEVTPLHMKVLCEKLKDKYDYIIIDGPAGVDDGLMTAIAGAEKAIIITTPEYAAIRDADKVDKVLKDAGIENRKIVINKLKSELMSTGLMPGVEEIAGMLRPDIAGLIQEDDNIHIAGNNGAPIVLKKDTYIYENFVKIAGRL